jgi:hypothetical protein
MRQVPVPDDTPGYHDIPRQFRLLFAYGRGTSINDQDATGRPDLLRL